MCNIIYKSIARWFVCRRRHCETRGQEKPVHLLVYEPRGVRVYIYIYMMCVCVYRYACICVYAFILYYVQYHNLAECVRSTDEESDQLDCCRRIYYYKDTRIYNIYNIIYVCILYENITYIFR